jgi:hypothetical protein
MGQFLDSIKKSNETAVKKVSQQATTTKGTSRSGVFDDVFAANEPNQSMIPTPAPIQFTSYNSEATKNGKKDISVWSKLGGLLKKAGAPVLNYMQQNRRESEVANFKLRQSMYPDRNDPMRTVVGEDGKKKRTNNAIEAYDNAKTDEERAAILAADTAEIPLIKMLNSPTGKKVTKAISDKTSNIPLKAVAKFQTVGDEIYEAFTDPSFKNAWDVYTSTQLGEGTESNQEKFKSRLDPLLAESVDETNPRWQQILYGVQNSGVQSAIGALLSIGTSYLTRNPNAAKAVGTTYFGAISAEGERQKYEDGNIDNPAAIGNIAIDTIGDQMLSGVAEAALKNFAQESARTTLTSLLKKGTQGFAVEGGTEVTQSTLKYANDYTAARTETEKTAIADSFADYIKSGAMLDEFLIGGISGAGINLVATGAGTIARPIVNVQGEELSPEKVESIKESITNQVDTALETGDFAEIVEKVAESNNLTEEAADTIVRDAAQDIVADNVDREAPVDSPEYAALQTDIKALLESGVNPADISIGLQEQASVSEEYANTAVATAVANVETQKAAATETKPTVETVVQKDQKANEYITQKLTESEVEADVIKNVAPSLVVAISGRGTAEQKKAAIELLSDPANESSRALYSEEMGIELPPSKEESRVILQREINKSKTRKMAEYMVWQELDQSEAGYRVFLPHDPKRSGDSVIGVPSTFPKWIPEELRSKDLFKKVSPTIETGKRPKEGKTAYKQAQLYDLIQERISQYEADLENNAYDIAEPTPDVDPNIPFQVANNQIQSESLITKDETLEIVRRYFSDTEVSVAFVNNMRTPRGLEAWGKYSNSVITFIDNPRADTPHHESVHAFLDLFVAEDDRAKFLKTAYDEQVTRLGEDKVKTEIANLAKRYNDKLDTDRVKALYAEEALADGFTEYVNGRNEKTALQQFFDRVIAFIKSMLDKADSQRLYEDIIARKRSKKAEYERRMRKVKEGLDSFSEKQDDTREPEIYLREGQPKLGSGMIKKGDEWVSIDEIVARERFEISKLKKLSFGGSDRDVYDLEDGNVLKIAKSARGLAQNRMADWYAASEGLIPEIQEKGKNYVVFEKVDPPNDKTKKMVAEMKKIGQPVKYFRSNADRDAYYKKADDLIALMESYGYPAEGLRNYGDEVLWGDFLVIQNWGSKNGEPILLDEGSLDAQFVAEFNESSRNGATNLTDPDFRDIYYQSRAAKKAAGDTDSKTMYSEKEPISMVRSSTYSVQPFKNLASKVPEFKKARAAFAETHAYTMGKETKKIESAKLQKIEGKVDGMNTESYAVIVDDQMVFISEKIEDSAKWLADNAGKTVSIEQNATATVFTDGNDAYAIVTTKDLIPLEIGNIQGTTNVLTIKFYDTRGQIIETHAITGDGTFKPLSLTAEATRNNSTRITFPSYFAAIAGRPVLVRNDELSDKTQINEDRVTRVDRDQPSQMPVEPNLNDPKIKKSRAYAKARERLAEQYQEDVTYTAIKIDDQMAKAFELVDTNFEYARAVALGIEQPPLDITDTAISIAVSERAKDTKDYQLQADTEKARSLRQSRRGQELVLERGRVDENSPEYFIRELIERRKHLAQNKYKPILSRVKAFTEILEERVTEAKKKGVKKLKTDLEIKGETLDDFLREMAC